MARRGAHGGKIPEDIQNAPELLPGLEMYMDAWYALSTCRPPGFGGPTPIPWTAIEWYCEAHEIVGEQREDMHFHVRSLDLVYLQHLQGSASGANR